VQRWPAGSIRVVARLALLTVAGSAQAIGVDHTRTAIDVIDRQQQAHLPA